MGGGRTFVFVKVQVTVSPSARPTVAVDPLTVVPPVTRPRIEAREVPSARLELGHRVRAGTEVGHGIPRRRAEDRQGDRAQVAIEVEGGVGAADEVLDQR